ncbi:hypothetical protein Taro_034911, partial [Colocasia esculenta]|nr:hypothetical protein [Colocasia esculenta]
MWFRLEIKLELLGPHNIQTYTEMVQRAQLVEDTMAKVDGMRGKDNSKPVFVGKGAPNIAPTFRNNNVNNNNKRPNIGRDIAGDKRAKVEGRDHRIPDCPMLKDQPGRVQNVPRRQGRLNAVIEADLPDEGGMVEGTISIHSQPAFVLIDTGAAYSFISTAFAATLPVKPGHVEELLVAEELWNDHKKPFFFPFSSAATCTNHPLEVDQSLEQPYVKRRKDRSAIQGTVLALSEPGIDPVNATARYVAFRGLIATYPLSPSQGNMRSVAIRLPDLTTLSRCSHPCVAFWARPVAFLIWLCRDLRIFTGNHVFSYKVFRIYP